MVSIRINLGLVVTPVKVFNIYFKVLFWWILVCLVAFEKFESLLMASAVIYNNNSTLMKTILKYDIK